MTLPHTRSKTTTEIKPHPIILDDGILIFHQQNLLNDLILGIISAPEDTEFQRRLKRDTTDVGGLPKAFTINF